MEHDQLMDTKDDRQTKMKEEEVGVKSKSPQKEMN